MTKRWDAVLILGLLLAIAFSCLTGFDRQCEEVRQSVLRFHILANSDSPEDQALKLQVRDAVLAETAKYFSPATGLTGAEMAARTHLPEIREAAQSVLRARGCTDLVRVGLVNMYFNTRTYDGRTLPAGYYDALRIEIGRARGHNWWCVMFPPLCIGAAADSQQLREIEALGEEPEYKLSFAGVEWLESLLASARGKNP